MKSHMGFPLTPRSMNLHCYEDKNYLGISCDFVHLEGNNG